MPAPRKNTNARKPDREKITGSRGTSLRIPCFKSEKKLWDQAAGSQPTVRWAREALNASARRQKITAEEVAFRKRQHGHLKD